jgi:hypothetical protein
MTVFFDFSTQYFIDECSKQEYYSNEEQVTGYFHLMNTPLQDIGHQNKEQHGDIEGLVIQELIG